MSRVCKLTGKRPLRGNRVSKSNIKTNRFQYPNLQKKRIFVPELNDDGVLYTPIESMNLSDVAPLRTEKITTFELGYKGFLLNSIVTSIDYYISFYQDFFSPPTVITPLVVKREFDRFGNDITNIDDLNVAGMISAQEGYLLPPYATQWNGIDDDGDWETFADAFGWRGD